VSTPQPTTGTSVRVAADQLAEAIRRQLKQKDKEKARELLLRGLAARREATVLTRHVTEPQQEDQDGGDSLPKRAY
jgi:hypothetical protein